MHYQIKPQPGHPVTGQLVITNHGGTPVTGWPCPTGWSGWWRGPQHGYGGWPVPVQGDWPGPGPGGWLGGR